MTDFGPSACLVHVNTISDPRWNSLTCHHITCERKAGDLTGECGRQERFHLIDIAVHEYLFQHQIGERFIVSGSPAQICRPDQEGLPFKVILGFRRGAAQLALHAFRQGASERFAEQARTVAEHFPVIRIAVSPDRGPAITLARIQAQTKGAVVELLLRHPAVFTVRWNIGFQSDGLVARVEIEVDFEIPCGRPFAGRQGIVQLQNFGCEYAETDSGQNQRK